MASTIRKYQLPAKETFTLNMPKGAHVLPNVHVQKGTPCIWAVVDPAAINETRKFVIVGPGDDIADNWSEHLIYTGTFVIHEDGVVFHLFEAT